MIIANLAVNPYFLFCTKRVKKISFQDVEKSFEHYCIFTTQQIINVTYFNYPKKTTEVWVYTSNIITNSEKYKAITKIKQLFKDKYPVQKLINKLSCTESYRVLNPSPTNFLQGFQQHNPNIIVETDNLLSIKKKLINIVENTPQDYTNNILKKLTSYYLESY